jgi:hypothetical protein
VSRARQVGLSRRDLEWIVASMTRRAPSDPAEMTKLVCDVMVTLIEKNNLALAKALERDEGEGSAD